MEPLPTIPIRVCAQLTLAGPRCVPQSLPPQCPPATAPPACPPPPTIGCTLPPACPLTQPPVCQPTLPPNCIPTVNPPCQTPVIFCPTWEPHCVSQAAPCPSMRFPHICNPRPNLPTFPCHAPFADPGPHHPQQQPPQMPYTWWYGCPWNPYGGW